MKKPQDTAMERMIRKMNIEAAIGHVYYTIYRVGKTCKCKTVMDWADKKQKESFCTEMLMYLGVLDAVGEMKGYTKKEESA